MRDAALTALIGLLAGSLIGYAIGSRRWPLGVLGVLLVLAGMFAAHSPQALQITLSH